MAGMKRITLLLASAAALCAAADEPAVPFSGAELGAWTQDYAAATNAAATSGKPVFLDFTGSDWCGWCMLMENKVFCTQEWQDWAATNIYLVTLDFPRDKSKVPEDFQTRNRELSKQYGVHGYPTYIVLDSKGEKLGQLGADRNATPAKFIRKLCGVLGIDPPAKAGAARTVAAKRAAEMVGVVFMVLMSLCVWCGGLNTERPKGGGKKLDQTKKLRELGRPPESLMEASSALEKAFGKLAEAAEACGVEDASDVLGF